MGRYLGHGDVEPLVLGIVARLVPRPRDDAIRARVVIPGWDDPESSRVVEGWRRNQRAARSDLSLPGFAGKAGDGVTLGGCGQAARRGR
jgi:hypothetical protein